MKGDDIAERIRPAISILPVEKPGKDEPLGAQAAQGPEDSF